MKFILSLFLAITLVGIARAETVYEEHHTFGMFGGQHHRVKVRNRKSRTRIPTVSGYGVYRSRCAGGACRY